ncbi:hypothetical protein LXA47_03215 [Massilia sp. P8910]|uniref:hypothetical protein n=1 Tax=Massilia antarctica TaxID=2765360 RepID=UPI001E65B49A|nr:hypothetical protein [Massilia antarctica]MCE3602616.1 hypothetical protein [Massilia antarctica]
MATTQHQTPDQLQYHPAAAQPQIFPSICTEGRSHVETACAAFWMNRKPQTLRAWASQENGPLRPIRVNGRLAWSVFEIRTIMSGGAV